MYAGDALSYTRLTIQFRLTLGDPPPHLNSSDIRKAGSAINVKCFKTAVLCSRIGLAYNQLDL
jgi:hypothetical protein